MNDVSDQQLHDAVAAFAKDELTVHGPTAEVPPRLDGEPMVMRGVRLPLSLDQRVKEAAKQTGVPFSTLIREWIELGLTEMETDAVVPLSTLRRAIAHAAQAGRAA